MMAIWAAAGVVLVAAARGATASSAARDRPRRGRRGDHPHDPDRTRSRLVNAATLERRDTVTEITLLGVEEPKCLIHAPNESVDPSEIENTALAEALFLQRYAGAP